MAATYCEAPQGVQIIQTAADSLSVSWAGAAATYKLAYKREEEEVYQVQTLPGPGGDVGSGLNDDDTGDGAGPTTTTTTSGPLTAPLTAASAAFTLAGLTPGVYDVHPINICGDGSTYRERLKFLVKVAVSGEIVATLIDAGQQEVQLSWTAPAGDSGAPYVVTWGELSEDGKILNTDSQQVPNTQLTFSFHPEGRGTLMVYVSQPVNDWQAIVSNKLVAQICAPC